MPKVRLTDRFIAGASSAGKPQIDLFDEQVPGLNLRVSAAGKKVWNLIYTIPKTKKRARTKLGTYPELSLAQARVKAITTKATVAEDKDPQQLKKLAVKAHSSRQTVQNLINDYFKQYVEVRELRSEAELKSRFERSVSPIIGHIPLADLHRRDILKVTSAVMERGALVEANRTFANIRAMIRWGLGQGYLEHNIMEAMSAPAGNKARKRVLDSAEISTIWNGLDGIGMTDTVRDIIRLLFHTACRVGEISELERSEVDLKNKQILLPAERVKNKRDHRVPLTEPAMEIIERALLRSNSQWVFANTAGDGPTTNYVPARAIIRARKRLNVEDWTAHDIRRTWATMAAELKVAPHVIAAALNHVSVNSGVTFAHYNHYDYLDERREAHEIISKEIMEIVSSDHTEGLDNARS